MNEILEHITSTVKPNGDRIWHSKQVEVQRKPWELLKRGDMVFIPGNLVGGLPTALYGPHKITDTDMRTLENRSGRTFFEGFPLLYVKIN